MKERNILLTGLAVSAAVIALLNLLLWNVETTYRITDGNRILIHTTAAESPAVILEEAGAVLHEGDRLITERTGDGPVLQLLRQQQITIDYYGEQIEAVSYGETVGQMLERLELTAGEGDTISVPLEQETYDGMVLRIFRELRQEQIYTVTLPCDTVYCCDPTLPVGTQLVLVQGKHGEILRTAEVTYTNGVETSRVVLSEQVTIQPVDSVVAVGTGQQVVEAEEIVMPVIGDGLIQLPTGEVLTYSKVISSLATAYCDKGLTSTGTQARVGAVAVDPEYIPYGTRMFIMSKDGEYIYGIATAEDCGSKDFIYGTRIDLHYDTEYECVQFGARMCWVYFLS